MQARVDNAHTWPTCRSGMSARLRAFIVISVAIHLLLLLGHSDKPMMRIDSQLGSSAIHVSLGDLSAPTKQAQATAPDIEQQHQNINTAQDSLAPATAPRSNRPEKKAPVTEITIADNEFATQAVQRMPATAQTSGAKQSGEEPTNATAQPNSEAQRNFLLGQVHNLLSRHLQYPLRARRRGWEGEVLLGFHVDHQGLLGNIHLARSSGYASLDRSAINALRKVKTIPLQQGDATLETGFRPMDLQLPVIYQLHEG